MPDGGCMGINPVATVNYADGHFSITFVPLLLAVGCNANLAVLHIDSIRSNTIPIGYTIFRCVLLVRDLEALHRKR